MFNKKVIIDALRNLSKPAKTNNSNSFNFNNGGAKDDEFISAQNGVDTPIYKAVKIGASPIEGKGLFADQAIRKGDVIGISHIRKNFTKNGEEYQAPFPSTVLGYYNHSEEPNVYEVDKGGHILLVAGRDILRGQELTSDYSKHNIEDLEAPKDFKRGGSTKRPSLPNRKSPRSYSRSFEATNKLFAKNPLFAKSKSRKNKIFDPRAQYYQKGGPQNTSGPKAEKIPADVNAMNGMMKARLAYANEFGNPAAKRMINLPDNPYEFENGDIGTHYMASMDNYAVPQIQDENGQLMLGDYGPDSREAIRFDSDEDANYFAEHYKDVSPGFIEAKLTQDKIQEYVKGGYIVEEVTDPSIPALNTYAGGGVPCPPGYYHNGTRCVKIPEETIVTTDPEEYKQLSEKYNDELFMYNSTYNLLDAIKQKKKRSEIAEHQRLNLRLTEDLEKYWDIPSLSTEIHHSTPTKTDPWIQPWRVDYYQKPNKIILGYDKEDEPIEMQPLKPSLINQQLDLGPREDMIEEDLNLPPEYEMPGYEYYRPYLDVDSPHQNAYAKWWTKPFRNKYSWEKTIATKPIAKYIQNSTGYDKKKMEGYENKEGIPVLGEVERAEQEGRRIQFTGANSTYDLKRQKKYNKAYDEYEKIIKQKELQRKFIESQMGLSAYFKNGGDVSSEFIDVELDNNEIDYYRKGGYIVEELPKASKGKPVKESKYKAPTLEEVKFVPAKIQSYNEAQKEYTLQDVMLPDRIVPGRDYADVQHKMANLRKDLDISRIGHLFNKAFPAQAPRIGLEKSGLIISPRTGRLFDSNTRYWLNREYGYTPHPASLFNERYTSIARELGETAEVSDKSWDQYELGINYVDQYGKVIEYDAMGNIILDNPFEKSNGLVDMFNQPIGGPLMLGMGMMGKPEFNKEIKNPDYFTQLLDTFDSRKLSSTNKKYYKDLINSVKNQNGLATERQYNELQRLKTGDFDFGKRGYAEGGLVKAAKGLPVKSIKDLGRATNLTTFGTANTLAKSLAPVMINPARIPLLGSPIEKVGPFTGSPLNVLPGYGETMLSLPDTAFRKFGDTLDYVKMSGKLSSSDGPLLRIGKNQIASEGNWAELNEPNEKYQGVFGARFDFNNPGTNLGYTKMRNRNGVLITDAQGNPLPNIPISDPGLSFHRRLPFSNRYIDVNMDKLRNNEFDWRTVGGNAQSLLERYGYAAGYAGLLGAMGLAAPQEYIDEYINEPIMKGYNKYIKPGVENIQDVLKPKYRKTEDRLVPYRQYAKGGEFELGDEIELTKEQVAELEKYGYTLEQV
jgi:hypothetical protein